MSLKIGDGIVENYVSGMNRCMIDESFGPKDETGAVFWVILNAHGDVNLPCTEEEFQMRKGRLQFDAVVISSNLLSSRDILNPF